MLLFALFAAVAMLLPAAPALADDGEPPGMIVLDDYTLEAGEVLEGDLVVVGGDAELENGSRIEGSVIVWGGSAEVSGEVEGDVVVFGGQVDLTETAYVEGNISTFGGDVEQDEGAYVGGSYVSGPMGPITAPFAWIPFIDADPDVVRYMDFDNGPRAMFSGWLWRAGRIVMLTLLMAGLAGLVAVLWPRPAARVGETALAFALPSGGVGLLTLVVALIVVLGLAITICLSPLALVVALVAGVAAVFGWVSLGILVGERIVRRGGNPFWVAALGAAVLTFLGSLMELVPCVGPCVGWIVPFVVASVGLGAVVLTRFGTRPYPDERDYLPPEPDIVEPEDVTPQMPEVVEEPESIVEDEPAEEEPVEEEPAEEESAE
jgi:hypothetical protein